MKKALYIGGFCMPDGNAAAQRVLSVGKLLDECGYDVRFCGLKRGISTPTEGNIKEFAYKNYPYPSSPAAWVRYLLGRDYVLSEIIQYCPDMVILYNHPAFASEHITHYCHKRHIKVIADITEWYEASGNPVFKLIKGVDIKRRMTKSHRKLDGLICISNYLADYYKDSGLPILNLPPLVDIEQEKWHQKIEKEEGVVKLIYAGSPGCTKDRLDLIISALDKIYTWNQTIIFEIIGITKQQYISTWKDTRGHPFVRFLGRISHSEVVKHLLAADYQIFLRPDTLPNRAGFPTKFVETITSGTIPITNLSSNLSDYIKDGVNGIVVQNLNDGSIQSALSRAITQSSESYLAMKTSINSGTFDFRNFKVPFQNFIFQI